MQSVSIEVVTERGNTCSALARWLVPLTEDQSAHHASNAGLGSSVRNAGNTGVFRSLPFPSVPFARARDAPSCGISAPSCGIFLITSTLSIRVPALDSLYSSIHPTSTSRRSAVDMTSTDIRDTLARVEGVWKAPLERVKVPLTEHREAISTMATQAPKWDAPWRWLTSVKYPVPSILLGIGTQSMRFSSLVRLFSKCKI